MAQKDLVTVLKINGTQFNDELEKAKKRVTSFDKKVQAFGKGNANAFAMMATKITAVVAVAKTVYSTLDNAVQSSMAFEKSLSSLQSITNVSTKELGYFKDAAIELSSQSLQTATDIVNSFQQIGGAMPELLKNKRGLVEVTEQAIILAEAAGITVPEATKALVGSLNQMGAGADKASEYINILAAGSQEGAAEIDYLNVAVEKAGGSANAVGVKFNELVAAIEAIAPKITDASQAGTALRNIFITLEKQTDNNLKPSINGFSTSLENLYKKQLSLTKMTEMFGKANVTAALALVSNIDYYKELTISITGTNTALEMQAINNNNLAGAVDQLKGSWEALSLTINRTSGFLKNVALFAKDAVDGMRYFFESQETSDNRAVNNQLKKRIDDINAEIESYENLTRAEALAIIKEKELRKLQLSENRLTERKTETESARSELDRRQSNRMPGTSAAEDVLKEAKAAENRAEIINQTYSEIISWIDAEIARLEKVKELEEEIINLLDEQDKKEPKSGSLAYAKKLINDLQEELDNAISEITRNSIQEKLNNAKWEKIKLEAEIDINANHDKLISSGQKILDEINKKPLTSNKPTINILNVVDDEWLEAEKKKENTLKGIQDRMLKNREAYLYADTEIQRKALNDQYKLLEKQSQALDFPIENSTSIEYLQTMASLINNIGGATDNATSAWLAYSSSIIQNIAALLPLLASVFKIQSMSAIAEQGKMPFPLNIIAMAATAAALASSIASIPKFASGGIIGSGTASGIDNVPILASKGEMIINENDQNKLWNFIKHGVGGSTNQSNYVEFKLRGADIYGSLNNYSKKISKF